MKFRQWLSRKIAGNNYSKNNGSLTDSDRERALMIRRQETALKQAEKQMDFFERLMKLEHKANPKESVVDTAIKQLLPVLMAKAAQGGQGAIQTTLTTPQDGASWSNAQIKELIQSNPKLKKHAQKFTDEQIREYIIQQVPNLSKESIQKIIVEVRT